MIGLGAMGSSGGGNSSSSTSNLSALAPPFTVDRVNPKPNSNPRNSPYTVEPYHHAWQNVRPLASGPELPINSSGVTSVPKSDAYQFSVSASVGPSVSHWPTFTTKPSGSVFAYSDEGKPYYSSNVRSVVGEDSLMVKDEGSHHNVVCASGLRPTSQLDYFQSSLDLQYGPHWVDNLGFDEGKQAKRVELDGSLLSHKASASGSHSHIQVNQGGRGIESRDKHKEDSGFPYQKFNQVSDRDFHTGSLSVGHMENKLYPELTIGFYTYDSNKTCALASSSTNLEPHPSVVDCEIHNNFTTYQNSCNPYEKCVRPVDNPFTGSSLMRSSPTVVIRPPPTARGNLGQRYVSRKSAPSGSDRGLPIGSFDHSNPSNQKDSDLKLSSEIKEDSFETNFTNFSEQGDGLVASTPVKELSSSVHFKDTFDGNINAGFASQLQDVNVSCDSAMLCDNVQVVNSTEVYSDIIDPHNPAVDSPCWKGAPSSKFSPFAGEVGDSKHIKENLDEYFGFDLEEHQNLQSLVDANTVLPEKTGEGNKNKQHECARNGGALAIGTNLDAICSSKEQTLQDDENGTVWISTMTSNKVVEVRRDPNMLRKESDLLNNLSSGFDMKVSDTKHLIDEEGAGMTLNDVSEGGAVAVHAAEKVLSSPTSQEEATECPKLPGPKLNVPSMIKAIHNLSALLLFHLSNDACSLEEEYSVTLKHIISNLDSCLSKNIIEATNEPGTNNSVGDTSNKLGESCDVGTISGSPHMTNKAANSHVKPDSQHVLDEDGIHKFSGMKDEKSPIPSPLRDDLDIKAANDMTKAMKKALEANFHFDEGMHSQALVFKSLWLEAEAKLCSIGCKARFHRMKAQMGETKPKAPQENQVLTEMTSKVCISSDPVTALELSPEDHGGTLPKPAMQNISISSIKDHADDVESSNMARLNVLKSREKSLKPINVEEEWKSEMVDGEHVASVMGRFNILKAREDSLKYTSMKEEQQYEMVDGGSAVEYVGPCIRGRSEHQTLNVDLKPHFLYQTGSLSQSKFGSYVDGAGYKSPSEFRPSARDDPIVHSLSHGDMINQFISGWRNGSSSDWEHVLKDDYLWKYS